MADQITRDLMTKVEADVVAVLTRTVALCDTNEQRFKIVLTAVCATLGHAAAFYHLVTPGSPYDVSACVNRVMDIIRDQNADALEARKAVQ